MSVPLTINGVTFPFPQQFDTNWGPTVTNWAIAVTNALAPFTGGNATLLSLTSESTHPATAGFIRLANTTDTIDWRNNANSANLSLGVNSSDQLTYNGTPIGATTSLADNKFLIGNVSNVPTAQTLSGDITSVDTGVITISSGAIVNSKVSATAAIALSKLASTTAYYWYVANSSGVLSPIGITASQAIASDSNGLPTSSTTTATELSYLSGTTSAVQTQLNARLQLTGGTMSGNINMASNKVVSLAPGSSSGDAATYGQTPQGGGTITNWGAETVTINGLGTAVLLSCLSRRIGDTIYIKGSFQTGTTSLVTSSISLPSGITIDSTKLPTLISQALGTYYVQAASLAQIYPANAGTIFFDTTDTSKVYFANQVGTNSFVKVTGSSSIPSNTNISFDFTVPVVGWSI